MHRIKCCLIEDNNIIGESVVTYLEHHGYSVKRFTDGESFAETEDKYEYHVYIIDIMLPELDGFTITTAVRNYTNAAILILTAKSSLEDKEKWFVSGADDFISKPFELKELLLRIQALLRRVQHNRKYCIDGFVLDFDARLATKDDMEVHLSPKEREILECLAQYPGIICRREDLLEKVWWEAEEKSSRSLDVCMTSIRKKLNKSLIQTVVNCGYRLKNS